MSAFDAEMYFSRLSSQEAAQRFLSSRYTAQNMEEAESRAYSNAQAFLHYIMHGRDLYEQGQQLPQSMQPLLFFYGAAHLIKACLLTVCPDYPEQTSQLAHGVSARKRKKQNFIFLEDEVKIQHQGLFPCLSRYLFDISQFSEPKIRMESLLASIPEMNLLLEPVRGPFLTEVGQAENRLIILPETICDGHQATWKTMTSKLSPHLPPIEEITEGLAGLEITLGETPGLLHGPRFFTAESGTIHTHLRKCPTNSMSELMIHYLLLYNLSMLSRYETEWWGELFALKSDLDYQAIAVYLKIAAKKLPLLIAYWLKKSEGKKSPGAV